MKTQNVSNRIVRRNRYLCYWEKSERQSRDDVKKELKKLGYKEVPTCNGGDDDRIIIDNKRKEWAFWEYGFSPFATSPEMFPTDKNLQYWYGKSN